MSELRSQADSGMPLLRVIREMFWKHAPDAHGLSSGIDCLLTIDDYLLSIA